MKKTRILLVDDHQIVLKGMSSIVRETLGQGCSVDTASTAGAAFDSLRDGVFDLCIFDIGLPDANGLDVLRRIRSDYPEMKIIVHTVHEQAWYMRAFLDADVDGILFKSADIYEISRALTTVLGGGTFYSHAARVLKNAMDCHPRPTEREMDVLRMLAVGATTEEISATLGISPNTTETHRRHLLEKFNARNVADLILKAVSEGLPLRDG